MRSAEEMEFDRLCDEYRKKFKRGYGIVPGDFRPFSEHIALLKEALETGETIPDMREGIIEP